jgi:hypothetical protein
MIPSNEEGKGGESDQLMGNKGKEVGKWKEEVAG